MSTILDLLEDIGSKIPREKLTEANLLRVEEIAKRAQAQRRFLDREVENLKKRFRDQDRT